MIEKKESINGREIQVLIQLILKFLLLNLFSSKNKKFQLHLLNSTDFKKREPQVEMLYGLFKHMAQFSNQNLSRNVTHLNVKEKML